MTSGIDICVADWTRMATTPGFRYCNSGDYCTNPMCKDCSTFADHGINAGFPGSINQCSNSFGQAEWCYNTPRPEFFTERFGPGPGTFITEEQAMHVVCLGFRGSDFGMRADDTGDGHTECILGQGTRTVGAHSHATGVGFDNNGINNHQLGWFAVPPPFLAEMAGPPIDAATLVAIRKLLQWEDRVSRRPLRYGMPANGDITILNKVLINAQLLNPTTARMNIYGRATAAAVNHLKRLHPEVWTTKQSRDGKVAGSRVAAALLATK